MSLLKLSGLLALTLPLIACGDDTPKNTGGQPGARGNPAQAAGDGAAGAGASLDPSLIKLKIEALGEWVAVNPQGATQRFLEFCGEHPGQVPPQAYLRAADVAIAAEQPQAARRVLESGLLEYPQAVVLEQRLAEVPKPTSDEAGEEPEPEESGDDASPFQYQIF